MGDLSMVAGTTALTTLTDALRIAAGQTATWDGVTGMGKDLLVQQSANAASNASAALSQLSTASAVLARSIRMPASAGAAELSGKSVTLRLSRRRVAAPIALSLTGLAAIIRVSGLVQLRLIAGRITRAPRRPTIIRAGNKRTMIWPTKCVHEILDHGVDWTDRLGAGETIVSAGSAPEGALTVSQQSIEGPLWMVRLVGGSPGVTRVLCSVQTSRGQLLEEAVRITVAN